MISESARAAYFLLKENSPIVFYYLVKQLKRWQWLCPMDEHLCHMKMWRKSRRGLLVTTILAQEKIAR
jgi:hypothetical protein